MPWPRLRSGTTTFNQPAEHGKIVTRALVHGGSRRFLLNMSRAASQPPFVIAACKPITPRLG